MFQDASFEAVQTSEVSNNMCFPWGIHVYTCIPGSGNELSTNCDSCVLDVDQQGLEALNRSPPE